MNADKQAAIAAALVALMDGHTKPEIVKLARAAGFRGDDARTSKEDLARIVAAHMNGVPHEAQGDDAPIPAPAVAAVIIDDVRPPVQQPPATLKAGQGDVIGNAVAGAIAGALQGLKLGIDEDAVNAIIDARLTAIQPAKIILRDLAPAVTVKEATHPSFEKVLRLLQAGINVLLVGRAGCGKSYLAKQIAKALGKEFGTIHCSAGVSESQVTGWLLPIGEGGAFRFMPSHFAKLYTQGNSLFLIDEIDAADANMMTVLNGALANGTLHIPQCVDRPSWERGAGTCIMAAANTFGVGADAMYVGRNQLDAATLDRFYIVTMDYDAALEHAIAGLPYTPGKAWTAAPAPTSQELAALGSWVLSLRDKVESAKLRRVISTRTLQKALLARQAGVNADEVKADILAGWTRDELAKVQA